MTPIRPASALRHKPAPASVDALRVLNSRRRPASASAVEYVQVGLRSSLMSGHKQLVAKPAPRTRPATAGPAAARRTAPLASFDVEVAESPQGLRQCSPGRSPWSQQSAPRPEESSPDRCGSPLISFSRCAGARDMVSSEPRHQRRRPPPQTHSPSPPPRPGDVAAAAAWQAAEDANTGLRSGLATMRVSRPPLSSSRSTSPLKPKPSAAVCAAASPATAAAAAPPAGAAEVQRARTAAGQLTAPSIPAAETETGDGGDYDGDDVTLGGYHPAVSAYLHSRRGSSSDADRSVRLCASRQRRLSMSTPSLLGGGKGGAKGGGGGGGGGRGDVAASVAARVAARAVAGATAAAAVPPAALRWGAGEVAEWVAAMGAPLGRHAPSFLLNNVDGAALARLTADQLPSLGVRDFGEINLMLRMIRRSLHLLPPPPTRHAVPPPGRDDDAAGRDARQRKAGRRFDEERYKALSAKLMHVEDTEAAAGRLAPGRKQSPTSLHHVALLQPLLAKGTGGGALGSQAVARILRELPSFHGT